MIAGSVKDILWYHFFHKGYAYEQEREDNQEGQGGAPD
jgi:hypothetical protein